MSRKHLRIFVIFGLIAAAAGGGFLGLFSAEHLLAILRDHADATIAIYLLLHIIGSLLMVPRSLLGIVAGAVFGLWLGSALSLAGATLGGLAGFLIARFLNAGTIKPADLPYIGPWMARAEANGFRTAVIARLVPGIPHTAVNYALGLSRMRAIDYVAGSAIGMIPTSFIFANIGASGAGALGGSVSDYLITAGWALLLIIVSLAGGWIAKRIG